MPRQAARLVLGRTSASSRLSSAQPSSNTRVFSTTPLRWADDSNNDSSKINRSRNDAPTPQRREFFFRSILGNANERSQSAASAIGSMSSNAPDGENKSSSFRGGFRGGYRGGRTSPSWSRSNAASDGDNNNNNTNNLAPGSRVGPRAYNLNARPGGNIISLKSLPGRGRGSFRGRFAASEGRGGFFAGRDTGRGGGARGGFVGRGRGRGGAGMRGRGRGRGSGGRGRGRGGAAAKKKKTDGEGEGEGEDAMDDVPDGDPTVPKSSIRAKRDALCGVRSVYEPSTTLESLIGWGPAVATNTAQGQAESLIQGMRVMGGGRGAEESDQAFLQKDVNRWLSAGKPIFFSSHAQKMAAWQHNRKTADELAAERVEKDVAALQDECGTDYEKFNSAYQKLDTGYTEDGTVHPISVQRRLKAIKSLEREGAACVSAWQSGSGTETAHKALAKYSVTGEHPEIKYAEDIWGRTAMYHAHERSYRPADAAKFEAKLRQLVRS